MSCRSRVADAVALTLAFCDAVCEWALPVLSSAQAPEEGRAILGTLLQLVLSAAGQANCGMAAARAAKVLLQVGCGSSGVRLCFERWESRDARSKWTVLGCQPPPPPPRVAFSTAF